MPIEDRTLALPLPLHALAEAMRADDAVARALLAKKNPVIEDALRAARLDGKREALLQILVARGLRVSKKADKHIRAERDEAVVDRWLRGAASCASVDALLRG